MDTNMDQQQIQETIVSISNPKAVPTADGEPVKSPHGERVEITARGELHTLEFPPDITADWDSHQQSLGKMNFCADHMLDSAPSGIHRVKPSGAR